MAGSTRPPPRGCSHVPGLPPCPSSSPGDRSPRSRGGSSSGGTFSGRCRRPAGPRERGGGGSVAPCPHAHTGGPRAPRRAFGCQPHRARIGVASREPRVIRSGPIEHGMETRQPRGRLGWGPPPARSWPGVQGRLVHRRQDDEPGLGSRGSRTMSRGTITTAGAGWPSPGAVRPRGRPRGRDMGQQGRQCWRGSPRQRLSTPGPWGDLLVAGQRHLRDADPRFFPGR